MSNKTENEIVLFECCVGHCEPKSKGNIGDIYYICAECISKDINEDDQRAINEGYHEVNGRWIKKKKRCNKKDLKTK
jgi:hypothetical protein